MAGTKIDLPDDLLSSKPSDHSSISPKLEASRQSDEQKVHGGLHDESKDQLISESTIPLSPQWLYSKPSENKMDLRAPTPVSLENSNDPSQKVGWRLDGSENKKDWRRTATESESGRRWREEERETGLLGARRDRRKTDRRVDSVSMRETMDNRGLPSSDRWHDGSNRNCGHETRRDSKWSSRWGPEDKEKDSRIEKRVDVEKEKEDGHNDNQSSIGGNRSASECDTDSRDKWRPRHRMEGHSAGSTSSRAAPGFGLGRGRAEGPNSGFTIGRGRSGVVDRSPSSGTTSSAGSYRGGSVIGEPNLATETFRYPRGKLLNIYRRQKLDLSFTMPADMEESTPITEVGTIEPLAFVTPDAEEEAILTAIWKGKITSSGAVYNSLKKGASSENVTGVGDCESTVGKQGDAPSFLTKETADTFQESANENAHQTGGVLFFSNHDSRLNMLNENEGDHEEGENDDTDVQFITKFFEGDVACGPKEIDTTSHLASQLNIGENSQMNSASTGSFHAYDTDFSISLDIKSKLRDNSSSLCTLPSAEQSQKSSNSHLQERSKVKDLESSVPPEDLYFYYIDPHGETQGPFLGADIIMWFEEGYFGTDLPICLADAPEGTPFKNLGEVIPHLQLRGGYPIAVLEKSGASGEKLEPSLPISSVLDITDSSLNGMCQQLSGFSSLSSQHAQSRVSEPEAQLQLPHSEGQRFHDFLAQDEEIVFPGRPGSSGYPSVGSSGNVHDLLPNSSSHSSPSELTEASLQYQNDNKLHPFGLLWSELENSHARHNESSTLSNQTSVGEKWSDVYRDDTLSGPDSFREASSACCLPHVEPEPNHFDIAEQLMAQQFQQQQQQQQQVQQQNMLALNARFNESLLEYVPDHNLIHRQQSSDHTVIGLANLLTETHRQQQQQQLYLQQQHQLQRQQHFHQQQKLLQERQQSQARQVLLEQFLHGQMSDPGLIQSRIDSIRANNVIDQLLLEQQLLHEMQQQPHHSARHLVPSIEQRPQLKYGEAPQQELQRDIFDMLQRSRHGQIQSLEHQIRHQEQLQARQLSMGLRQQANMEEERHFDSGWPVNENDLFLRNLASSHRVSSLGMSPLDFYQRQLQPPHEDQLSHLERNLSFQDRLRQGHYESGSGPFERSLSLPAGSPGMNMDVDAMVRARGLDMQQLSTHSQSACEVGKFSSGIHPQNPHWPTVPNQFNIPHLDTIEGRWSESNGQLEDWMGSQLQQLNINTEQQRRDSEVKSTAEDPSLWGSDGLNDEKSRRLLMELLHQKSSHHPADSPFMTDGPSFQKRAPSRLYSLSNSLDHDFRAVPERQASVKNPFAVGFYGSNACERAEVAPVDDHASNMQSNKRVPFALDAGATFEGHSFLSGIGNTAQEVLRESKIIDNSSIKEEFLEVEGRKDGPKSQLTRGSVPEIQDGVAEQVRLAATDCGDIAPVNALRRHSSLGVGFYDDSIGPQSSFAEDIEVRIPSKGQDNILLRQPPVSHASASQDGLSDLVSNAVIREKGSLNSADGANPVNQGTDILASGKKEMRFRRTLSYGDADVSEPSFIDMLKSNARKTSIPDVHAMAGVSESSDGMQGSRSGKKKGKKGRQIDPALLGFKVTSNRIMMGEIQRLDE